MTAQQIRDEFTGSEADWSSLSRSLNKEDDKVSTMFTLMMVITLLNLSFYQ